MGLDLDRVVVIKLRDGSIRLMYPARPIKFKRTYEILHGLVATNIDTFQVLQNIMSVTVNDRNADVVIVVVLFIKTNATNCKPSNEIKLPTDLDRAHGIRVLPELAGSGC